MKLSGFINISTRFGTFIAKNVEYDISLKLWLVYGPKIASLRSIMNEKTKKMDRIIDIQNVSIRRIPFDQVLFVDEVDAASLSKEDKEILNSISLIKLN